jgi:GT2 family glycosyltransferase
MKVLIATVTAEQPRYYEYYDSLHALRLPPNSRHLAIHSSSPARNRNVLITTALEQEFSHVFFTDDDQTFPADTLLRLLAHDVPVVSGLYTNKFQPFQPVAFDRVEDIGTDRFIAWSKLKPYELCPVVACGAGCLLVNTDVFRVIERPWFELGYGVGHMTKADWGDDLSFCAKVRAAGVQIYLDPAVRSTHLTKAGITPIWNEKEQTWYVEQSVNFGRPVHEAWFPHTEKRGVS